MEMDPSLADGSRLVLHWKYERYLIIFIGYRNPQTNAQIEGAALD
jgi:hypothetical protein